jgi:hypothetical protein
MKHIIFLKSNNVLLSAFAGIILLIGIPATSQASTFFQDNPQEVTSFNQFKGEVVDGENNKPLVFATLTLEGSNISKNSNKY